MNFQDYTEQQMTAARGYAASITLKHAACCMDKGYFAEHITPSEAADIQFRECKEAQHIMEGMCDNNFTVRQRMEFYLTGKSTPLLSPGKPS